MDKALITPPRIFQAKAIARGLDFYALTGMKPNTAWSPKAMLATASRITGQEFGPKQYAKASQALHAWVAEQSQ